MKFNRHAVPSILARVLRVSEYAPLCMDNSSGGSTNPAGQNLVFTDPHDANKTYPARFKRQIKDRNQKVRSGTTVDGEDFPYQDIKKNKCECCKKLDINDECDDWANDVWEVFIDGEWKEVKICKWHAFKLLGREEQEASLKLPHQVEAPVTDIVDFGQPYTLVNVILADEVSVVKYPCSGGCPDLLREGALKKLTILNIASELGDEENIVALVNSFNNSKNWRTKSDGVKRSSSHYTSDFYDGAGAQGGPGASGRPDTWSPTREQWEAASPALKEFFEKIERKYECKIHDGHATYISKEKFSNKSRKVGCMDAHTDKWYELKPLLRAVLTIGKSENGKFMRFTDMEYGRWVEIPIEHGTCVMLDPLFAGTTTGRYIHGVRGAEGTYTIVFDFGRTKDGDVVMFSGLDL